MNARKPGLTPLLFVCLLLCGNLVFAQIEIKVEQSAKGDYVFTCNNKAFCNYILELGFTSFINLKSDITLPFHAEVKPGVSKLFTISPVNAQLPVDFRYKTANRKGCINPLVNNDFSYLYPISPSHSAQVYEMSPGKSTDSAAWYVLRLKMKSGDTIYASRKGRVTEVQAQHGENDAGQTSIGTENFIEIVQPDCSFARYGILRKDGSLVQSGQNVKAGQPIGIVGGDAFSRGSEIRFSVYYYQESGDSKTGAPHYIVTEIWTKNNGKSKLKHGAVYISEFPTAILNMEEPAAVPKKNSKKK